MIKRREQHPFLNGLLVRLTPNTVCKRGIAIFTIVPSRMVMKSPKITTIATIHLYGRLPIRRGGAVASDACIRKSFVTRYL